MVLLQPVHEHLAHLPPQVQGDAGHVRRPRLRRQLEDRSTCSGASLIPGISGAIRIPVRIPARLSSATASSRARGCGVCGSVARHAFSSSVGTDSAALKSATR